MTTSGKVPNKNPVASPKANPPNVAIPLTSTSTEPLLVSQNPNPARQPKPSITGTTPLLVSQSPTPAWQSKPLKPYLRTKVQKSEPKQVRLHHISTFVNLASSYIDILRANDTRIVTTPWYYLWMTWVKHDIIGTQQISTVTSIIDYPKSRPTTLRDVAEHILEKLPVLQPFLTFHKNTKRETPLCTTYRPILLHRQKPAAATKTPPPEQVFAAFDAIPDESDDEALALEFGEDIEELYIIDSLALGSTTTNLDQTDLVLPTDLIEDMIAIATIVDDKIDQEIEDINRIPDQSIPSTRSDDITPPPKVIDPANLSISPLPAESN